MVVTPAEGRTDPAVQLTTLPGWRHFVAAVPSIPELFTQAEWLALDADNAPLTTKNAWNITRGWWWSRRRRSSGSSNAAAT